MEKSIFSDAHRKAISNGRMGVKYTEEAKARMSEAQKLSWIKRRAKTQKTVNVH